VWCSLYGTVCRRKRPGNTQNGETVLPIANPVADSESGRPDSYSSNHTSISPSSRDIRVWQTDGRTTQTITIAGSHVVAGQLISLNIDSTLLHTEHTTVYDFQAVTALFHLVKSVSSKQPWPQSGLLRFHQDHPASSNKFVSHGCITSMNYNRSYCLYGVMLMIASLTVHWWMPLASLSMRTGKL